MAGTLSKRKVREIKSKINCIKDMVDDVEKLIADEELTSMIKYDGIRRVKKKLQKYLEKSIQLPDSRKKLETFLEKCPECGTVPRPFHKCPLATQYLYCSTCRLNWWYCDYHDQLKQQKGEYINHHVEIEDNCTCNLATLSDNDDN